MAQRDNQRLASILSALTFPRAVLIVVLFFTRAQPRSVPPDEDINFLLLALEAALLSFYFIAWSIRRGEIFHVYYAAYSRVENPRIFWITAAVYFLGTLTISVITTHKLLNLNFEIISVALPAEVAKKVVILSGTALAYNIIASGMSWGRILIVKVLSNRTEKEHDPKT